MCQGGVCVRARVCDERGIQLCVCDDATECMVEYECVCVCVRVTGYVLLTPNCAGLTWTPEELQLPHRQSLGAQDLVIRVALPAS